MAEHSRHIRDRKQVMRYGLEEQINVAEEVIASALYAAETEEQQSKADPCVFYQWKSGKLNVVSIYMDDLILVVDLMEDLQKTKADLSARFKMKDLGQLRYCIGIVCNVSEGKICINQKPYIDNLVRRFGLSDALWSFNSGRRLCGKWWLMMELADQQTRSCTSR